MSLAPLTLLLASCASPEPEEQLASTDPAPFAAEAAEPPALPSPAPQLLSARQKYLTRIDDIFAWAQEFTPQGLKACEGQKSPCVHYFFRSRLGL